MAFSFEGAASTPVRAHPLSCNGNAQCMLNLLIFDDEHAGHGLQLWSSEHAFNACFWRIQSHLRLCDWR